MADNKGNIDPIKGKITSDLGEATRTLKSLETSSEIYKESIKDSINLLKELGKSYAKINNYSESLNKSTINVNKLQRQLEKANENKLKAENKLKEFDSDEIDFLNQKIIKESELLKKISSGELSKNQIKKANKELSEIQNNLELQLYKSVVSAVKKSEEEVEIASERVKKEKDIEKSIGKTGAAVKLLNKFTGVGKELYAKMVEEARDGEKTTKNWVIGLTAGTLTLAGLGKATNKIIGKMGDMVGVKGGGAIGNIASNVTGLISKIPLFGPIIGGLVDSFANLLDFAVGAGSKIQEMGRSIGLSKEESIQLNNEFSNFTTFSGKAYLNSEKLYKTFLDISNVLGTNNKISNENLQTQYELNNFLKVDAETSAEIERSSLITGKSSKDIAQNIFSQTKNLERATGISFNFQKILKEASSLGGVLGLSFSKYPEKITKAVLATKAMGIELKQLDSMADSFLDFESSITKEFEAQLLTGKEINLAKAREAFLNNDLVTAAEEITKQVGDSNEFLSLNRVQQDSIANAMGMSRDQMADMLKQQEYLSKFGAKDVKDLHEKVKLLRQQGKEQEAINLLGDKEAYNKMVTATASEDLAGFIEKIKQSFADLVSNTKLADFVQNAIQFLSKPENLMSIINKIKNVFATIVDIVGSVIGGIMKFLNIFPGIKIEDSMIEMVTGAGDQIRSANLGSLSLGNTAAKNQIAATSNAQATNASSFNSGGMGTSMGQGNTTVIVKVEEKVVAQATVDHMQKDAQVERQTGSTSPIAK